MSLIENLIHNLGLSTKADLESAISKARSVGFSDGYDAGREAALAQREEFKKEYYAQHEYVRLTSDQFEVFRKLVTQGNVAVTGQTTELQAGQIIGVNHALNILRDGFVVDVHTAAKPV